MPTGGDGEQTAADKLEARAKALRDAAELLLRHDAMEG